MAGEQMLRGEPTRHIPYTLYNYVVISIQGCHVRVYGKHVRFNYIITQPVNYGFKKPNIPHLFLPLIFKNSCNNHQMVMGVVASRKVSVVVGWIGSDGRVFPISF